MKVYEKSLFYQHECNMGDLCSQVVMARKKITALCTDVLIVLIIHGSLKVYTWDCFHEKWKKKLGLCAFEMVNEE